MYALGQGYIVWGFVMGSAKIRPRYVKVYELAVQGHREVVEMLTAACPASLSVKDRHGCTPRDIAQSSCAALHQQSKSEDP
jgi:hypothetical protein